MGPFAVATWSSARRRAAVSATSQVIVADRGVKVRRSVASLSSRSVVRASPTTVAPARARSSESWAPRPDEAPVTTATRPS